MWHPTLCVLVVAICSEVATLNPTDEGVCKSSIQIRSPRTRLRFYTAYVNKWCGKKKCVVKKSKKESYVVTIKNLTLVCCNGWEYQSPEDRCIPSCTIGCSGGRCTAPDVCECDPPSHLNPQKNSCITPTCDRPCVNAICQDDTCKCHLNFSTYNSTHCVPQCEDGYHNDPVTLSCTPYCESCYGVCTAPNVCECPEGYTSNAGTCEPICEPACENAACVSIQSCVCHEGYIPGANSWTCVPKCDACENGDCAGPNLCVCRDGFVMNHGVCSPRCNDKCVNSVCTAPEHCSCLEGYVKEGNESVCFKPCEGCNGTCVEGECVPVSCRPTGEMIQGRQRNGKARRPVEICCSGWTMKQNKCIPICTYGCRNGTCVAPNTCRCDPGLILMAGRECVRPPPTCKQPCVNSHCTADNVCTCNSNYQPFNATHCAPKCPENYSNDPITMECTPKCERPCTNGTCTAPGVCTCDAGYKLAQDSYTCIPDCNPGCVHADCVAPNTCTCHEGYSRENNHSCRPICDTPCEHGDCTAPNVCKCHDGYSKNGGACAPVCEKTCGHSYCSAPNVCTCNHGYEVSKDDNYSCVAICNPKCNNSNCTSPNTCSCLEGYEVTSEAWSCKPTCVSCTNGDCVAPGDCRCHDGYSKLEGVCVPNCANSCVNGICSAPNVCSCHNGYKFSNDKYTCVAVCDPGCVNANCTAPNTCSCFDGYKSSSDPRICAPKCTEACKNGLCTAPEFCSCIVGYLRNSSNPSECYKPCPGPCNMGTCSTEGECECQPGYELKNDTCVELSRGACSTCGGNCTAPANCVCDDGRPCYEDPDTQSLSPTQAKAGFELTWLIAGAVVMLLVVALVVVIMKTWQRKKDFNAEPEDKTDYFENAVFAVPNTIKTHHRFLKDEIKCPGDEDRTSDDEDFDGTRGRLLTQETVLDAEE